MPSIKIIIHAPTDEFKYMMLDTYWLYGNPWNAKVDKASQSIIVQSYPDLNEQEEQSFKDDKKMIVPSHLCRFDQFYQKQKLWGIWSEEGFYPFNYSVEIIEDLPLFLF